MSTATSKDLKVSATVNLNSSWLANLFAQTSGFLAFLVATPFLIHLLGKAQFGALTLFTLMPQIASQLDFGLTTAGTRAIGQFNAQEKYSESVQIFWEVLGLLIGIGLLLGAVIYLFSESVVRQLQLKEVIKVDFNSMVFLLATWCLISLINAGLNMHIRALEKFKFIATMQALSASLLWLGALVLVYLGHGLLSILYWANVILITIALLTAIKTKTVIPITNLKNLNIDKFNFLVTKEFFRFGFGIFVSQAASLFTYNADKFIVSALVSPSAAGMYTACTSVANKSLLLVAAIAAFAFPRTVRLHTKGKSSELSLVYEQSSRASIMATMVFTTPVIGLAASFLGLWLGINVAADYVLVLMLLGLGYFFAAFSVVSSNVSIGLGDSKTPALFAFLGGLLTVLLSYSLTKKFGIHGSAFGMCLGAFQAVIFNWLVAKKLSVNQAKNSIKLFLFSTLIVLIFSLITYHLNYLITTWIVLILTACSISFLVLLFWFVSGFANKIEMNYALCLRKKLL